MTRAMLLLACLGVVAGCSLRSEPFPIPVAADVPRLEASFRTDPADVRVAVALAVFHLEEGRPEAARAILLEADRVRPGDPAIPILLAIADERLGEFTTARDRYEVYRDSRLGLLAGWAMDRLDMVWSAALREDLRALLSAPLPDVVSTTSFSSERVAILPLAGPGNEISEGEGVAVAALLGFDLAEVGRPVVDARVVRILLDEMGVSAGERADISVGVEVGRRLGATRVVQGSVRDLGSGISAWDVSVLTLRPGATIGVDHLSVAGLTTQAGSRVARLSVMVDDALAGRRPTDGFRRQHTVRGGAIVAYGQGLRAMDRGDVATAAAEFRLAVSADSTFVRATALASRTETLLRSPSLDQLVREVARVGEMQRSVNSLRLLPGSAHQAALSQVGASGRSVGADALGLDQLEGGAMLELVLPRPGLP